MAKNLTNLILETFCFKLFYVLSVTSQFVYFILKNVLSFLSYLAFGIALVQRRKSN